MIAAPGFSAPDASASSIMARATRSFALPAGLRYSSFASSRARRPSSRSMCVSSSSGVPPMSCSTEV